MQQICRGGASLHPPSLEVVLDVLTHRDRLKELALEYKVKRVTSDQTLPFQSLARINGISGSLFGIAPPALIRAPCLR